MKERNENRPGYKKTKVGWIPKDWSCCVFSSMFQRVASQLIPKGDKEYREIGIRSHGKGVFHKNAVMGKKLGTKRVFKCEPGTLAFNIVFAWEQAVAVLSENEKGMIASHRFPMYRGKSEQADENFICWYFRSARGKYTLGLASPGGAGRNKTLGQKELDTLFCPVPNNTEQQIIGRVLSTNENQCQLSAKLIAAKKLRKKGLMQKLLTGKRRLPGFKEKWESYPLSKLCTRVTESAEDTKGLSVLSITAGRGFVSQEEKFSRVIAGRHIENYVLLSRGEFAYNKGNSNRFPQGCVYRLKEYDQGLVPDVFYSFRVREELINAEYIAQYFSSGLHGEQLRRWINTGVRNNGLLNLDAKDFFNLKIPLPEKREQEAVAALLLAADNEIVAEEKRLEALQEQRRGLMQKLLTGEVRVKR